MTELEQARCNYLIARIAHGTTFHLRAGELRGRIAREMWPFIATMLACALLCWGMAFRCYFDAVAGVGLGPTANYGLAAMNAASALLCTYRFHTYSWPLFDLTCMRWAIGCMRWLHKRELASMGLSVEVHEAQVSEAKDHDSQ